MVSALSDGDRNFHLLEIGEPRPQALRLVVVEAGPHEPEEEIGEAGLKGRPVVPRPGATPIELTWDRYIAYHTRNESFAAPDRGRPSEDSLIEISGSSFIEFVTGTAIVTAEYPGLIRRWSLVCIDHVIDVVATAEPTVRPLRQSATAFQLSETAIALAETGRRRTRRFFQFWKS